MNDAIQIAFDALFLLIGSLAAFVLKALWDAVKDLQKSDKEIIDRIQRTEVLVAGDYIKRSEIMQVLGRFEAKLDAIDRRLQKEETQNAQNTP